jgi:hypothetical protein
MPSYSVRAFVKVRGKDDIGNRHKLKWMRRSKGSKIKPDENASASSMVSKASSNKVQIKRAKTRLTVTAY